MWSVLSNTLCLEEMLGVEIPDGDVWYGGPRRRVRVAFTPTLRHEVGEIIHEVRQQLLTASLPEAPNDPRCAACQLQHHCLPDVTSAPKKVTTGTFDPPVPRGFTLHDRLVRVSELVEPSVERLVESLHGTAARVKNNGLGFDIKRLASQADDTDPWVDPVIEVLVFFGLALLPVRGIGTDKRTNKFARSSARQRGWKRDRAGTELRFHWPAWSPPLDSAAIDALLDIWSWKDRRRWASVGVHGGWRTVRFQRRSSRDVTRGFGAERL